MSKTLFIGDSHTVGYQTIEGKVGPGSYSFWNDNNYCEQYSSLHNKPVIIYAQPGAVNSLYTNWLKTSFEKHPDIDEVYICLAPLNRMVLSFDPDLKQEADPVDHFMIEHEQSTDMIKKYSDQAVAGNTVQLLSKPTMEDYQQRPDFELSPEKGLIKPDVRKDSYMKVKLWNECNTTLEKREFLLNIYAWDNICADHNAKLYVFNFRTRGAWPNNFEYFGKMKTLKRAGQSVEQYLNTLGHKAEEFYLEDNEHFNKQYHELVAKEYLKWLKEF